MKMRKIIFSILFAVIAFIFMGKGDALAKVYNDFVYSINDDNYACFTSYWGEDENVVIPSEVVINGVTYPVVIGNFDAGEYCKNLSFDKGVKFTDKTSFKNNFVLESIDLTGADTSEVTQMKDFFLNCYKLSSVKFGNIDTSNVISFYEMFRLCYSLENVDFGSIDTSNVVDMHSMFYFCNNLKSISLNGLNTSNVTDISYMFSYCLNLNDLDLSSCDFSSVTKKDGFISNCFLLNTIKTPVNISSEQIIALPTDSQLIYTDDNGNNYYSLPKGDDGLVSKNLSAQRIGELNNYSYTISDNNIYITAYYGDGGDFKVPSTLEVDGVSYNVVLKSQCKFINVKKLSFEKGVVINASITGNMLEEIDFNDAVNKSTNAYRSELIQNNAFLKKVTFGNYNLTNAGILDKTNIELFASGCYELEEIDFSNVDTSNLTDIAMAFNDCKSLETINFSGCDFSNLDVDLNNRARSGIEKCENLKYIYAPINIPEGLSIKLPHKFVDINGNMYTYLPEKLNESILLYSYENVDDLESIIPDSEWLKNFKYTTSRVTFLTITGYLGTEEDVCIPATGISEAIKRKIYLGKNSFGNTGKLSFEEGVIANTSLVFNEAKFSEIDLTGLDMSKLKTDGNLFNNCENLEKIIVPAGFTSGVTINLPCPFKGNDGKYYETIPTGLSKAIVLSNRDGDTTWQEDFTYELDKDSSYIILTNYNGTEAEYKIQSEAVIDGVSYTTYIDGLETGKYIHSLSFEPGVKIGNGPFIGNEANLVSIDLTNADTSEVTNMAGMFQYFSGLKRVDFGNIDTSNVVKFDNMFSGCTSLEDVDFGSIDTSNVISFNSMFYDCVKITDIDVSVLDTSKATDMDHMFMGCTSLQKLDLSGFDMQNCTKSLKYMLKGCTNLGQINTPVNISDQLTAVLPDVSPYYYTDETGNIYENLPNGTYSASSMLLTCVKDGELSKYTYTIDSDSGILSIKSYRADSLEDYAVPAALTLNGVTYQTAVSDGCNFINVRNLSFENGVLVYGAIAGSSIKTIDFTGADDEELKGNDFMFKNLSSLESINFGGFDITKNSTSLSMTFYNCSKLKEVDFSNMDTGNITTVYEAFTGCNSLETLNFTGCDLSAIGSSSGSSKLQLNNIPTLKYIYTTATGPNYKVFLPGQFVDEDGNLYTYLPTDKSVKLYSVNNVPEAKNYLKDEETDDAATEASSEESNSSSDTASTESSSETSSSNSASTEASDSSNNAASTETSDSSNTSSSAVSNNNTDTTWQNDFEYSNSNEDGIIYLQKYIGSSADEVVIPATAIIDGTTYKSVMQTSFKIDNVKKLSFENGVVVHDGIRGSDLEEIDFTGAVSYTTKSHGNTLAGNSKLKKVTWGNFNLFGDEVVSVSNLFMHCSSLTEMDFSTFDTSKVTEFRTIFIGCTKLKSINMNGCDLSSLTTSSADPSHNFRFDLCSNLQYIYAPINVPEGANLKLPGEFVDEEGNFYTYLPEGLTSSKMLYAVNTDEGSLYSKNSEWLEDYDWIFKNDRFYFMGYDGSEKDIVVPSTAVYRGEEYPVVIKYFASYNAGKTSFDEGILTYNDFNFIYSNFAEIDLTNIDFSSYTGDGNIFKGCTKLETITVPANFSSGVDIILPSTYADGNGNTYTTIPTGLSSSLVLTKADDTAEETSDDNLTDTTWQNDYTYSLNDFNGRKGIWLSAYNGTAVSSIEIPVYAVIDGVKYYTVIADGCDIQSVDKLSFEKGVYIRGSLSNCLVKEINLDGAINAFDRDKTGIFQNNSTIEKIVWGDFNLTRSIYGYMNTLSYLVQKCTQLVELDLSGFDTSHIKEIDYICSGCTSLEILNLNGCDLDSITSNVDSTSILGMNNLKYIYTPINFNKVVSLSAYVFIDEDGNWYNELPVGLGYSIKLYSINNCTDEAEKFIWPDTTEFLKKFTTRRAKTSITLKDYVGNDSDINIIAIAVRNEVKLAVYVSAGDYSNLTGKLSFENGVVADSSLKFINGGFKEVDLTGIDMSALSGDGDIFESCENLEKITVPSGFNAGVSVKLPGTYTGSNGKTYTTIPTGLSSSIVLTKTDNAGTDNSSDAATEVSSDDTLDNSSTASSTEAASDTEGTSDSSTTGTGSDSGTSSGTTGSGSGADSEDSNNADMSISEFGSKFVYGISGNTIYLRKYVGPSVDNLVIPATVNKNGTIYKVSIPTYCNITNVRKVSFKRGVIIDGNFANSAFEEIDFTGAVVGNSGVTSNSLLNNNVRLKKVTWGDFDLSKYTEFENTFAMCRNLKEIDFSRVNTSCVVYFYKAFSYNLSLETLNMSGCDLGNYRTDVFTFWDWGLDTCTSLKNIYAPTNLPADVYVQLPYTFYDAAGNEYKFLPTGLKKSILLVNTKPLNNDSNENNTTEASGTDNTGTSSAENGVNTSSSDTGNANNDGSENTNTNPTPTNSDTTEQSVNPDPAPTADNTASTQQTASTTALNAGSKVSVSTGNYVVSDSHNVTYKSSASKNTTKVTIPSSISVNGENYPVTVISANAFKNCKKLKSVSVPTTVTKINANAFKGCKSLKKIVIKANVNLKVNKKAFKGVSSKTTIVIKGVKGKTKVKLVKQIQKQTKAKVK